MTSVVNQTLELVPGRAGFAAEVRGIDLAAVQDETSLHGLREALAAYGVLSVPDQKLDAAGLQAFTGRFGDFGHDPFVQPMSGHEHVIEVCRDASETAPIFGSLWHSDWSFQSEPPAATILLGAEVPPVGGDTVFANAAAAFDALSPVFQDMLSRLQAVHTAAPAYGPKGLFSRDDDTRTMDIIVSPEAENTQTHPIVRSHPVTGRKALFVNHVYTVGIDGMREQESRALLEFLFKHMTRGEFVHRHRWQAGTVLMWDNRSVVHYADGGYEGHRRLMYRTTVAGEQPIAA